MFNISLPIKTLCIKSKLVGTLVFMEFSSNNTICSKYVSNITVQEEQGWEYTATAWEEPKQWSKDERPHCPPDTREQK